MAKLLDAQIMKAYFKFEMPRLKADSPNIFLQVESQNNFYKVFSNKTVFPNCYACGERTLLL